MAKQNTGYKSSFNVPSRSVEIYVKEISKIPLLTKDEEKALAKKAAAGDCGAKRKLIRANLRFVLKIAKQYSRYGVPLIDLVSEGNIGLMKSVDKFDAERNLRFVTYSYWWIRQAILKAVYQKGRMIKLPINKVIELSRCERVVSKMQAETGKRNVLNLAAGKLGVSEDHLHKMLEMSHNCISLDMQVTNDGDTATVNDFIEDTKNIGPEEQVFGNSLRTELEMILKSLKKRDAEIIRCRYGFNAHNPMALEEIGRRFGVTRERIRQIIAKSLNKLRRKSDTSSVKCYIDHG